MPKKPKRPKRTNRPLNKGTDQSRLVQALSLAEQIGSGLAAKQTGVSQPTINRYRQKIRAGLLPELSIRVQQAIKEAQEACQDLAEKAIRVVLNRIIDLAPTLKAEEAMNMIEKLGDFKMARDSVNGQEEINPRTGPSQGRQGQTVTSEVSPPAADEPADEPEDSSNVVLFKAVS